MILSHAEPPHHTPNAASQWVQIMARRKFVVLAPILIAVTIAWLIAAARPPEYTATAVMAIDARKIQVVNIDSVVSGLPDESAVLRTELDVLSSRSMAMEVAERLDLVHDPDFLRAIGPPPSLWQQIGIGWRVTLARFGVAVEGTAAPVPLPAIIPPLSVAVDWLLGGLRVSNDGRSFTIPVSFVSHSPRLSAQAANAFATAYLDDQIEMKRRATRDASAWLAQRLEDMRQEVEDSEAAVLEFQRAAGLLEARGGTMNAQRLGDLNAQLATARSARARAEARLRTAQAVIAEGGDPGSLGDVLSSSTVLELRKQIALLDAKIATERQRWRWQHPSIRLLEEEKTSLARELAAEAERVIASLDNEAAAARREETNLRAALHAAETQQGESGQAIVRLNQLQREAEANRGLYESFLNRYKETIEQEGLATPDARILSQAEMPAWPAGPRKLPLLMLGLVSGTGIGLLLAVLRERLDQRVRCLSEIEDAAGVPVFGLVPDVPSRRRPEDHVMAQPHSPFSEALRRAHATLHLARGGTAMRVLTVTSAVPGEGKTSFCVCLARSLARSGLRVLVIDADLRRPGVAEGFGAAMTAHINDVIRGQIGLAEAVGVDAPSGAHFLAAKPTEVDPELLLTSGAFAAMIADARDRYDIILVDTPPVSAATDAAAVCALADTSLFLVRWGSTQRHAVLSALRLLNLCGARIDGVIVTHADPRRHGYDTYAYDRASPARPTVAVGAE